MERLGQGTRRQRSKSKLHLVTLSLKNISHTDPLNFGI